MYFFTADEHYGHANILEYCHRPFNTVEQMDEALITNHNAIVGSNDVVVHAGDFTLKSRTAAEQIIKRLNGNHIFLRGSHDRWLPDSAKFMWRKVVAGRLIVVCHYALRTWEGAYHDSWQLHGHSHGRLEPLGLQWDVGVDNNNFYPVSFEQLAVIMAGRKKLDSDV